MPIAMMRCWRQRSSGNIGSGVLLSCTTSPISPTIAIPPTIASVVCDRLPPCTSTSIKAVIATINSSEPR
jgi:hypothetical protein